MNNYQADTMQAPYSNSAGTSPAQTADRVIQLHRDLTGIVTRKLGIIEPFASQFAGALLDGLREDFGGGSLGGRSGVYIPAPDKSSRNAAIRSEFNGVNKAEVCKKYAISIPTLYRIVGRKD